ncbi:MAG: DUF2213 domain-containing protein [Oscillospiraceae bacterium]|jgi:hypothetical protein|nr:DUF2213 domain-containing protein [Oscillospiraceae bacterium]
MSEEKKLLRVRRLDSVPLEKVEYTPEGFLIDTPIVTSVGVFEYKDSRELRLPEHVFAEDSLATYEGKPVIITHSAGRVNKKNVTDEIVGTILSKGYRDGDDVRAKIIIHDIDAVKRSGFRELSLGYDLTLDDSPGEWNGQPYDAIQTDIVINHLAIVREARAGEQARLNIDNKETKGETQMSKAKKQEDKTAIAEYEARRKRRLDAAEAAAAAGNNDAGNAVAEEVMEFADNPPPNPAVGQSGTAEERAALIRDRRDRRDAEGNPADLESAQGVIARQDEDIEQLLKIVEELQAAKDVAEASKADDASAVPPPAPAAASAEGGGKAVTIKLDSAEIDAIVTERLKLGRLGDKLNLDGIEQLNPLDAKKRVIKAIKPDLRLDGKGEHYVNTAFDIAVEEFSSRKDTEYQRKQMFNADGRNGAAQNSVGSAQSARERMIERMQNGGKE